MSTNRKIYRTAVACFGHNSRVDLMVEECAELIQAIQKFKRGLPHNVSEEIADVEIMVQQLKLIFPGVSEIKKAKLEKLEILIREKTEAFAPSKKQPGDHSL